MAELVFVETAECCPMREPSYVGRVASRRAHCEPHAREVRHTTRPARTANIEERLWGRFHLNCIDKLG